MIDYTLYVLMIYKTTICIYYSDILDNSILYSLYWYIRLYYVVVLVIC